jgi:hypothetical protein
MASPEAMAYNPESHSRTVLDAYEFAESDDLRKDVNEIFGIEGVTSGNLSVLAHAARELDYQDDLFVRPTSFSGKLIALIMGLGACISRIDNLYLTSMQHFLLIPKGAGAIWNIDGYGYRYTDMVKRDKDFLAFESWRVQLSDAKLDTKVCRKELPPWFKLQVQSEANYQNNLEQELRYVIFPPATNLAAYYYDLFLDSPDLKGKPGSQALNALGRVLHLVQDMTVPHHVVGLLGSKHIEYEAYVDALYLNLKTIKAPAIISRHLQERPFLSGNLSVTDLMVEIAEYTRSLEVAEGRFHDGLYFPGDIEDEKNKNRIRNLTNLSIAANVAVLKKAMSDWKTRHSDSSKMGKGEYFAQPAGESKGEVGEFSDFRDVPIEKIISPDFLVLANERQKAKVLESLSGIRNSLSDFHARRITELDFQNEVAKAKQQLSGVFIELLGVDSTEQEVKLLKLGTTMYRAPIINYRQPQPDEVATYSKWQSYSDAKLRFESSLKYLRLIVRDVLLKIEQAHIKGEANIPTAAIEGFGDMGNLEEKSRNVREAEQLFREQFRY